MAEILQLGYTEGSKDVLTALVYSAGEKGHSVDTCWAINRSEVEKIIGLLSSAECEPDELQKFGIVDRQHDRSGRLSGLLVDIAIGGDRILQTTVCIENVDCCKRVRAIEALALAVALGPKLVGLVSKGEDGIEVCSSAHDGSGRLVTMNVHGNRAATTADLVLTLDTVASGAVSRIINIFVGGDMSTLSAKPNRRRK